MTQGKGETSMPSMSKLLHSCWSISWAYFLVFLYRRIFKKYVFLWPPTFRKDYTIISYWRFLIVYKHLLLILILRWSTGKEPGFICLTHYLSIIFEEGIPVREHSLNSLVPAHTGLSLENIAPFRERNWWKCFKYCGHDGKRWSWWQELYVPNMNVKNPNKVHDKW